MMTTTIKKTAKFGARQKSPPTLKRWKGTEKYMDEKDLKINLDAVKTFYDPHPGFLGAAVPIPDVVKKVARELNCKTMTIRNAVLEIQAVTNGKISVVNGAILLKVSATGRYLAHMWRVIKYGDPASQSWFRKMAPALCGRDTSADPQGWTPENPLWGHCAIIALAAEGLFGGELLRASLDGTKFSSMRSHYWNRLPSGKETDFSRSQFGDSYPAGLRGEVKTRDYVLFDPETKKPREIVKRYELFCERLSNALGAR
jgi:hypothetical protein